MTAGLAVAAIEEAVGRAGLGPLPAGAAEQFSRFAELLLRWNARMNLTAIRTPEEVLQRHFLEGIFCARQIPEGTRTLLDFGSGAGFPGIPIVLCRPEIEVTLGEAQSKKAAFLREAVRTLGLKAEVFDRRVEQMEAGRVFDVVAMRAVDRAETAVEVAAQRVGMAGSMVLLTTGIPEVAGFEVRERAAIPGSDRGGVVVFGRRG
jgi:16S rRNA (guanine527-N7)-methyltransferase